MAIPIDPLYIPAFSLEEVLLDKDTGAPLSGGLVYFEKDAQRGVPKPVFQITGTSPNYSFIQLPPNPLVLSSIGTFEDSLGNPIVPYFFPYNGNFEVELYYVRVTSSTGVPQFDREAVPYVSDTGSSSVSSAFENEISNPQFAEVLFDPTATSYVYSFTAGNEVVEIAPDWSIVVSSSGAATVTVSQVQPQGALNIITNPGTLLNIDSAGLDSLRLRQRIYGSPNLWGSGFLSGTFIAKTYEGTATTLTLYYSQSNGAVVDQVIREAILPSSGAYGAYPGSIRIPTSTSVDNNPDAYIDIEFDIPPNVEVDISSVMVAYTDQVAVQDIIYDQESNARQIDHLFHYYKPQLAFKPIPSLLTAWDFGLNPAQLGTSFTVTGTPAYTWDQTIAASLGGNVTVTREPFYGSYEITTGAVDQTVMIMQYLSGASVRNMVSANLCVNVEAYSLVGSVTASVHLLVATAATAIPILGTIPFTLNADGTLSGLSAGWTEVPRGSSPVSFPLPINSVSPESDVALSGWYNSILDTDKFAIVVTFVAPTSGTEILVQSVSLNMGEIPTRPAPQTYDEVLRECEYYLEISYAKGGTTSPVQSTTDTNPLSLIMNSRTNAAGTTSESYASPFALNYQTKFTIPSIALYSPSTGTLGQVFSSVYYSNGGAFTTSSADVTFSTYWTEAKGKNRASYTPIIITPLNTVIHAASTLFSSAGIKFHYTIDARLGA